MPTAHKLMEKIKFKIRKSFFIDIILNDTAKNGASCEKITNLLSYKPSFLLDQGPRASYNHPMIKKLNRNTLIFLILIFTVIIDQITKVIARATLSPFIELSYLNGMFTMRHTENKGAFLSLGADMPDYMRFWIFSVFVLIGLTYILWTVIKDKTMDLFQTITMSFIIGGGIGNLIDRIFRGSVTDFLNVGIGEIRTGIFNFADMYVTFGAIILFIRAIQEKLKK